MALSIVVLRALGLGDLLTAVPALRALRRGYPEAEITLATSPWLAPLLPLIGAVDRLLPVGALGELGRLEPVPDLLVNLHGRGPESIADALASGARSVLSYAHPAFPGLPGAVWSEEGHEVGRWCRLMAYAGLPVDAGDLHLTRPEVPSATAGAVVVHPGSKDADRRWPPERFAAVARRVADTGARVVVTGSAAEGSLVQSVVDAAGLDAAASLAGRLDLAELAALVADAALVVSGDTGVAHLASAYRTPSVVVFGAVSPARWGPPAHGPHRVIWRGPAGLSAIGAEEVADAALEQLGPRQAASARLARSR